MLQQDRKIYEIQYTKAADGFFRQHEDVREACKEAMHALLTGEHPEGADIKRIRGRRNDYYRIRLGDYSVIYALIQEKIVIIGTVLAGK